MNGLHGQGGDRFRLALSMLPFSRNHTGMMLPGNTKDTEASGELIPVH